MPEKKEAKDSPVDVNHDVSKDLDPQSATRSEEDQSQRAFVSPEAQDTLNRSIADAKKDKENKHK